MNQKAHATRPYHHGGGRNPKARLTRRKVAILRAVMRYDFDYYGWQAELAAAWGVSRKTINDAVLGRTWPERYVDSTELRGPECETMWELVAAMEGTEDVLGPNSCWSPDQPRTRRP